MFRIPETTYTCTSFSLEHRLIVLSLYTDYNIYHKFLCCNILNSFVCYNTGYVLKGRPHKLSILFCEKKSFYFKIIYLRNALPCNVINAKYYKSIY